MTRSPIEMVCCARVMFAVDRFLTGSVCVIGVAVRVVKECGS